MLEVEVKNLRTPSRGWCLSQQRTRIDYVLGQRGGYAVTEVAQYFQRDTMTISSTLSRYEGQLEGQPELRRRIERLAQIV